MRSMSARTADTGTLNYHLLVPYSILVHHTIGGFVVNSMYLAFAASFTLRPVILA